jgi:hypothetical protein
MGQARRRGSLQDRVQELWIRYGVKPMSRERYNAFIAWTRSPAATFVGEEIEFFSSADENLIGVVVKDKPDRDFGFVTLGRDEKGRFRCIDVLCSMSRTDARHALFKSIKKHADTGQTVFPQGDANDNAGVDLFAALAPEEKLHPYFKILRDNDVWLPAKSMMSEMMRHFIDVDGNFAEQFQTSAFDSRIWELYLYAALLELGLFVSKPAPAPDFKVMLGGEIAFIEAVIVGPSAGDPPPDQSKHFPRTIDEIRELSKTKIPIKFGSTLYSKKSRKPPYWELDEVKGHPFIFAIADFHEAQSMMWTATSLTEYLYGVSHDFSVDEHGQLIINPLKIKTHEYGGKKIPSGFFQQPDSEFVSAILFSSSGTISKFNRMGFLAGFSRPGRIMIRQGLKHRHDPNAVMPDVFVHDYSSDTVKETWAEGLSMFHNPNARHPVDVGLFRGIAHHFFRDGQIESFLPELHVYNSMTFNFIRTNGGDEPDEVRS